MTNITSPARLAADAVVEAACLVAVISLPLYFSVLTGTGYEADKAVLFRVIALVAALGWVAGAVLAPQEERRQPGILLWLALLVFAAYVVATVTSIDPRLSLWGSQTRQQGLWTDSGYLVIVVCVATRLRSSVQITRLVTALLLGSVPVVAYGLLQALGVDPIPSTGDPNTLYWPVRSSLGQHIFLGSYLIMLIPFTAERTIDSLRALPDVREIRTPRTALLPAAAVILVGASFLAVISLGVQRPALYALLPAIFGVYGILAVGMARLGRDPTLVPLKACGYGALLLGQIIVLAATGARGAWLGLFAGIPVFGILLAWRLGRARLWRGILALSLAGGLFLFLLNLPQGPLQSLRSIHGLNRLANITESGGAGGSAQGRLLIWQGVVKLAATTPAIGGNWGGPGRDLVGYGPETMHWAFQPVFPLKLRQVTSEIWTWDRAHNIYLDHFVDAGVLGLLAFLLTIGAFYYLLLRRLQDADSQAAGLLIAAAAAMTAHIVDGFFGLDTAVTLLLFWLLVGLVAAAPYESEPRDAEVVSTFPEMRLIISTSAIIVAVALLLTLFSASAHPAVLAAVWLVGAVAGIAVTAASLYPFGTVREAPFRLPRRTMLILGAAGLLAALALGSQARFETAAMAERAGLDGLAAGNTAGAIGYLQEASTANGYEPQYQTELGGAYLDLAASRPAPPSGDPTYLLPSPHPRSMDVSAVLNLPRSEILQLGEVSLESAQALAPLDPDAYANLGNLYLQSGEIDRALAEFQEAERLSPQNPRYIDQEALAQLQAGRTSQAMSAARTALDLDNTFWYSHYAVALVQHSAGSYRDARQEATLALYWMRNYWPQPPATQVAQLRTLARTG